MNSLMNPNGVLITLPIRASSPLPCFTRPFETQEIAFIVKIQLAWAAWSKKNCRMRLYSFSSLAMMGPSEGSLAMMGPSEGSLAMMDQVEPLGAAKSVSRGVAMIGATRMKTPKDPAKFEIFMVFLNISNLLNFGVILLLKGV